MLADKACKALLILLTLMLRVLVSCDRLSQSTREKLQTGSKGSGRRQVTKPAPQPRQEDEDRTRIDGTCADVVLCTSASVKQLIGERKTVPPRNHDRYVFQPAKQHQQTALVSQDCSKTRCPSKRSTNRGTCLLLVTAMCGINQIGQTGNCLSLQDTFFLCMQLRSCKLYCLSKQFQPRGQ